jgi:hypothetical protein
MTADEILAFFPVASGDRTVLGLSAEQGRVLVAAGVAVKRARDGAIKLTRSGEKRRHRLSAAASGGTIRTVAAGAVIRAIPDGTLNR